MCSVHIFVIFASILFTEVWEECSSYGTPLSCDNDFECFWRPGKCEALTESECSSESYEYECPAGCEWIGGYGGCINTKDEECAAAGTNEAQCSGVGYCEMRVSWYGGTCISSSSGVTPNCPTGPVYEGCPLGCEEYWNFPLLRSKYGVNYVSDNGEEEFNYDGYSRRTCSSLSAVTDFSRCSEISPCTISHGSCVVDSQAWNAECGAFTTQYDCQYADSFCFENSCYGRCTVEDGQCVGNYSWTSKMKLYCDSHSPIPTSPCTRAGHCKVSDSQCVDLTAEEQCSKLPLSECTQDVWTQCQINGSGFCVPYTPTCIVNHRGDGFTNPESDGCIMDGEYRCRPVNCSDMYGESNCNENGCEWLSDFRTCFAASDCYNECSDSPPFPCERTPYQECRYVASEDCEQHLSQAECGKGCKWSEDSNKGQCVEKTCANSMSYGLCCPEGEGDCPYCKDEAINSHDCPYTSAVSCGKVPSYSHCCQDDPTDGNCTAFCNDYPSFCDISECTATPSYSVCCPGLGCSAYCAANPLECCSYADNAEDCSGNCVWLPGRCEAISASACSEGSCTEGCRWTAGKNITSCVNTKAEVCAPLNEDQCQTTAGCTVRSGVCSRSIAEPNCDVSVYSYNQCPLGCIGDFSTEVYFCESGVKDNRRSCSSLSVSPLTECASFEGCEWSSSDGKCVGPENWNELECGRFSNAIASKCSTPEGICTVSHGSCVVDSLRLNLSCMSSSGGDQPESECGSYPFWYEKDGEWVSIQVVCEQKDGRCVASATAAQELGTFCSEFSTVPISQCAQAADYCKVSGSQCVDLSAEEKCSKLPLSECADNPYVQCQIDASGFCAPYTPNCIMSSYGSGCINPSSDRCVFGSSMTCRPVDCSENNNQHDCGYDNRTGCEWLSSLKTCVPSLECKSERECYSYSQPEHPQDCVYTRPENGECTYVYDGSCEQHLSQADCGLGCRWNDAYYDNNIGRCVDRTCSQSDLSFDKCCSANQMDASNCPYCKTALERPEDCPQNDVPSSCETAPSYSHCCQGNPTDSKCTAFCSLHPSLCVIEGPDCMTNPSYIQCCPGYSCNAYCALHPLDCPELPDGPGEPEPEPEPVACNLRTPERYGSNKCGENCYYTADLETCSFQCSSFYYPEDFTCKPKPCDKRDPDTTVSSNKCGRGCSYIQNKQGDEVLGSCGVMCAARTPEGENCGSEDCYFVGNGVCSPDIEDRPPAPPPSPGKEETTFPDLADPSTPVESQVINLTNGGDNVELPPLSLGSSSSTGPPVTLEVIGKGASGTSKTTLDVGEASYQVVVGMGSNGPTKVCLLVIQGAIGYLSSIVLSFTAPTPAPLPGGHAPRRRNADSLAFAIVDGSELTLSQVAATGTLPAYFIHFLSGTVLLHDVSFSGISLTQYFITLPTGSGTSSFTLSSCTLTDLSLPRGSTHALFHEAATTSGENNVTLNKLVVSNVTVAGQAAGKKGLTNEEVQTAVVYHSRNSGSNRKIVVKNSDFHVIKASDPFYAPFVISGSVSPDFKASFSKTKFYSNKGYYAGAIYVDAVTTVEISSSSFWQNEYTYPYAGYGNDISAVGGSAVDFFTAEGELPPCSSSGLPAIVGSSGPALGICPGEPRADIAPHPQKDGPLPPDIKFRLPAGAIAGIVIAAVVVVVVVAVIVTVIVYQLSKQPKEKENAPRGKKKEAGQEMDNV